MKRIAYITDIHLKEQDPIDNNVDAAKNWNRILTDVVENNITEIVFGGDIGDSRAHAWFFDSLKNFSYKITLGNHDNYKTVMKYYNDNRNDQDGLYYSDEDDFFKYIFLDTSTEKLSAPQLKWMKQELNTEKKIILFVHHPVLAVNTPVDKLYPLENRNEVESVLLESKKNITIFCGHYHMPDEKMKENIRQIITPASSYQNIKIADKLLTDGSQFGYRIIQLDNGTIQTKLKIFTNEVLLL